MPCSKAKPVGGSPRDDEGEANEHAVGLRQAGGGFTLSPVRTTAGWHSPELGLVWRSFAPAPPGHGRMSYHRRPRLRVAERQPGSPFEIGDEHGAELGVCKHLGVVSGHVHQGREPEPLLVRDADTDVLVQHPRS